MLPERDRRLREAAARARDAESRGDPWTANEEWSRYELIRDGGRSPGELLAEAIELSNQTAELAENRRG